MCFTNVPLNAQVPVSLSFCSTALNLLDDAWMIRDALVPISDLFMNGFKAIQPDSCSAKENNFYSCIYFEQHRAEILANGMLKTQKIENQ